VFGKREGFLAFRLMAVLGISFFARPASIERGAVLGVFNASDIRQNSNVSQHRIEAVYQAHKNVQLAFTGYIGRPLNFGSTAPPENLLKRLQFDVIYKFSWRVKE